MSQTLNLTNFPAANILETSHLDADAAVGTDLTLKSNQGFSSGDFIIIGRLGSETAELRVVDAANANQTGLTITEATKFAHDRFDPVTKLFGNKMKIYRAANSDGSQPADASFSLLASGTIDIDPDQVSTRFVDADGSSDYWYKRVFHNPTADTITPLALATAYRGAQYPAYATVEEIRDKAGLNSARHITDEKIDEKRLAAQSLINATLTGTYTVPFSAPVNPLIKEITQLLAAGYLLTQEATSAGLRAQGQALIEQATNDRNTGLLDKLDAKILKLTGMTGESEAASDTGGFSAWPNASTATAEPEDGGGERKFRVSDRY